VVIVLLCVVSVAAVVDDGYGPWSPCDRLCESGASTRTCINSALDCSSGIVSRPCATQKCVNCTVSALTYYSTCTKLCGGGTTFRARYITQAPDLLNGGTPCPPLNYTYPCNTDMCMETIGGMGFFFWGPFKGPGPISYTIRRIDTEVDAFLFTQDDFVQYQYDAARIKPFQTNYSPLRATLNIETVKSEGPIGLDANTNYYLVVDHTLIGAAAGTANNNGGQDFNQNRFQWAITGLEQGPGYNSAPVMSAATSTHASVGVVAIAAVALLALF